MFEPCYRFRHLILVVIPVLVVSYQPARGAELVNKRHVLSVGIDRYKSKDLNPLHTCVNDARRIAALFEGWGVDLGWTLKLGLVQEQRSPLLDADATKARILESLLQLGETAPGVPPFTVPRLN